MLSTSDYDEEEISPEIQKIMNLSREARNNAYCPYSNFHVGAAILCQDGTVFSGANVENASYGLSMCGERVALMTAVAAGYRHFKAIALCCDIKKSFKGPCGACRQTLAEFGLDWYIYAVKPDGSWKKLLIRDMLPLSFGPASLDEERDQL